MSTPVTDVVDVAERQASPAIPSEQTYRIHSDDKASNWSIGRVAPTLLLVWALVDVGLRFAPIEWLHLEPSQVATRFPGRFSPFTPNLHLEMNPWVGELAVMGNLRPTETRSPIAFTTDSLGFRNSTPLGPSGARVIVMEGDSFTFGFSLSDDETFPVSLSRELGVPVYNAGRYVTDPERMSESDWLLAKVKKGPMAVVYVLQELDPPSLNRQNDQRTIDTIGRKVIGPNLYTTVKDELRFAKRFALLWGRISPLRIMATRVHKAISDDHVLPNPYRKNVVECYLPNHDRFLFDHDHLNNSLNPPDDQRVREAAEYLHWLQAQFAKRGVELWVLMLPEAASVYGPAIFPSELRRLKHDGRTPFFDRMESALIARNIPAVNGLSVLQPLVAEDIAMGHLAYYREDHHWTPLGVGRIARAMATAMRSAGIHGQTTKPTAAHAANTVSAGK